MDFKKAADITAMISKLIDAPLGKVAAKANNPIAPTELVALNWKLIFGDAPDDEGAPGTVVVLASCDGQPILGWQARDINPFEIIGLIATMISLLDDSAKEKGMNVDIRQETIGLLKEMIDRDALAVATDGKTEQ